MNLRQARLGRTVAAVVAVASVLALAALALAASAGSAGFALAAPAATSPTTAAPTPATAVARPAAVPVATSARAAPPVAAVGPPTSVAPVAAPAAPAPGAPIPGPPAGDTTADCALGLPVPEQTGGVSSLIGIVPLFGPFTAEAFALSPAWAPFLDVLGPSVAAFGDATEQAAPVLGALTPLVHGVEDAGFEAFDPLYGPYREQFLASQAQAAAGLAPGAQALSTAPGTECLVALQALLFPPPVSPG